VLELWRIDTQRQPVAHRAERPLHRQPVTQRQQVHVRMFDPRTVERQRTAAGHRHAGQPAFRKLQLGLEREARGKPAAGGQGAAELAVRGLFPERCGVEFARLAVHLEGLGRAKVKPTDRASEHVAGRNPQPFHFDALPAQAASKIRHQTAIAQAPLNTLTGRLAAREQLTAQSGGGQRLVKAGRIHGSNGNPRIGATDLVGCPFG